MPNDVRPYFVPRDGSVRWSPWKLVSGSDRLPLPDYVDGWEPGLDIHINRQFEIDRDAFESDTLTQLDDCLVHISWQSSTTDMVDAAPPITIPHTGSGSIDVDLLGYKLAGTLTIYSRIVLSRLPSSGKPMGSARIPGSVLNEHVQTLVLENPTTMFPLQVVDFARTTYAPDASWHLDVDGDLGSPFMGAVLLQINSRDTELCEAVSRESVTGETKRILNDQLEAGIAELLIELAILNGDELLASDWPADSVGDVLKKTLARADLLDATPPTAHILPDFRTLIAGAVRKMGRGRLFQ